MTIVNCLSFGSAVAANYVGIGTNAVYTPVTACTFTVRGFLNTNNTQRFFWSRPDVTATTSNFGASMNANGTIRTAISDGAAQQTFSSVATVPTGQVVFLAFRYQQGGNVACTVDGTHNSTAATITANYTSSQRTLGVANTSSGNANLDGLYWDFRYYNSYLSDSDLDTLRTTGTFGAPTCYWPCDEGTGTTVGTDTGGNNGTITGSVGWSTVDDGFAAARKFILIRPPQPGALPGTPTLGNIAAVDLNGTTTENINLPLGLEPGDLVFVTVCFRGGTTRQLNSVSPLTWQMSSLYGGNSDPIQARIAYRIVESDTESSDTIGFNVTGTSTKLLLHVGKLTAANGFAATPLVFGTATDQAAGTSINMPTVDITNVRQRAFALLINNVGTVFAAATGETGGNWVTTAFSEADPSTGFDYTVAIQTSDQSSGDDISGGTATWTDSGAALAIPFAAVPALV